MTGWATPASKPQAALPARGYESETEELNIQHLRDIQHLGISGASKLLIIGAPGDIRTPGLLVRSYTRAPLLSSPGYAGVRRFNGLFIAFFFLLAPYKEGTIARGNVLGHSTD